MAHKWSLKNILFCGIRLYSSCINLNDAYILSAVRTPIGCFQGKLQPLSAVQLATKALTVAVEKATIGKDDIQELVIGCAFRAGLGQGPAHQVAMFSGLSHSVIPSLVDKACGSGMKALMIGHQLITSNTQEVVAVGGMESLSNIPYLLRRKKMRLGNLCVLDPIFSDALIDVYDQVDVTHFAEELVKEYKYTREDMDKFTLTSYAKAEEAQKTGAFKSQIVPVELPTKKDEEEKECVSEDEQVKRLNKEKLGKITPDIGKGGTITPGNSSGLHDGAAVVILASGNYILKKSLTPLARIVSYAEAGVEPRKFVIAPSVAIPKALVRANLKIEDITKWEISETFALTTMLNTKILQINPDLVNPWGGAISLGHPFGMTGVRLIVNLVHLLQNGELGCASMCHGPGGGTAMVIQKM